MVNLDEVWVYLNDCDKKRYIFYYSIDGIMSVQNDFVSVKEKKVQKRIHNRYMFLLQRQMINQKVTNIAKINLPYCQRNILESLFEEEILVLYGNDIGKFQLHMYKDFSHTYKSTAG